MATIKSIRPFIGSLDYQLSRSFYKALGFSENWSGDKMSYHQIGADVGFYLQDYYAKEWVENTMLFLERSDLESFRDHCITIIQQPAFSKCRVSTIQLETWGREFFLHDPAGILWHIGEFA